MKSISFIIIGIALIIGIFIITNLKDGFSIVNKNSINNSLNPIFYILNSNDKSQKQSKKTLLKTSTQNNQESIVVEISFPEEYKKNPPTGTQFVNKRYLVSNELLLASNKSSEDKFIDLATRIKESSSNNNQLSLGNNKAENICGARGFGEQCGGGENPLGLGVCANSITVPLYEQCKYTSLAPFPAQDVGPGCPSSVSYSDDCTCKTLTCLPKGLKSSPSGCPASLPQRCLSHLSYTCNGPIGGIIVSGNNVLIDIYSPCAKKRTLVEKCAIKPISCDQCCGGRAWLWDSVGNGCGCG